ncbi:MAG: TOBE domain-containing protein [Boseongicola sp.]|nr:TOBE domain-containing protein [Boseongicola sp.]
MNLLAADGEGAGIRLPDGTLLTKTPFRGPVTLGIRPENIEIVPDGIPCRTVYSESLGSHSVIVAALPDGQELRIATPLGRRMTPGEALSVRFMKGAIRLFDPESGKRH